LAAGRLLWILGCYGLRRHAEVRKSGKETTLGPVPKSQLSAKYLDGVPAGVSLIILSTQHLDKNLK